jgi:very-short-patch-repair endonuclease
METSGYARKLRNNLTDAEQRLWRHLRRKQVAGFKFRRQCHIGPYIVDFVSFDAKLVIEVDGGQHSWQTEQDVLRTRWIKSQGFTVIRFWNHEVLQETDSVLQAILERVERQAANRTLPPPLVGGGQGEGC